jgi:hypothetical protein
MKNVRSKKVQSKSEHVNDEVKFLTDGLNSFVIRKKGKSLIAEIPIHTIEIIDSKTNLSKQYTVEDFEGE